MVLVQIGGLVHSLLCVRGCSESSFETSVLFPPPLLDWTEKEEENTVGEERKGKRDSYSTKRSAECCLHNPIIRLSNWQTNRFT